MEAISLSLYAVRNQEGKYFRAKGYGGYGSNWVDDIQQAKIYPKIGQARSRVTFFANNYPSFGVPELIELKVTQAIVVDESKRVESAKKRKEREILNKKIREAERKVAKAQSELDSARIAKTTLDKAKEELDNLRSQQI